MWYSMSLFYDSGELGPAYATVAMATAVASVLGGPIAACLLMLNGLAGLHGWQASLLCLLNLCSACMLCKVLVSHELACTHRLW